MAVKVPKTHFWVLLWAFMGFMGPKRHFYGSQKPQIEFNYIGPALFQRDPMKKWHLHIKSASKSPKNPFFGAFMGFMGPKPRFYGSQKPKNLYGSGAGDCFGS